MFAPQVIKPKTQTRRQRLLLMSGLHQPPRPGSRADANFRATTSLAIGLKQTTQHTLRSRSDVGVGRASGGHLAPAASELPPPPSITSVTVLKYMVQPSFAEDPSLLLCLVQLRSLRGGVVW